MNTMLGQIATLAYLISVLTPAFSEDVFLPEYQKPFYHRLNSKCWGYEEGCDRSNAFSQNIKCSHPEDVEVFYREADFGYVAKRLDSLLTMCDPQRKSGAIQNQIPPVSSAPSSCTIAKPQTCG